MAAFWYTICMKEIGVQISLIIGIFAISIFSMVIGVVVGSEMARFTSLANVSTEIIVSPGDICIAGCIDSYGPVPLPSPNRGISRTEVCISNCMSDSIFNNLETNVLVVTFSDETIGFQAKACEG